MIRLSKEDIRIKQVILHIMDATVGMPVLSDQELELGPDLADFLKEHISKIVAGDDSKPCTFYQAESEIYQMLSEEYHEDNFIDISKRIAELLYEIMNSNVDIPSADLLLVRFTEKEKEYLGILKMNFKTSYTHRTKTLSEEGNFNEMIKYRSILPSESQRLQEAAIIDLSTWEIQLLEKKYEVNGEKTNYFSYLFLKCNSSLSPKSKLAIVTKAIATIQKAHCEESETLEAQMNAKQIIQEEMKENGGFVVEEIAQKVFEKEPEMQNAFQDVMERYNMVKEEVKPQSENTTRKYQKQHLLTDTGIEIKIPMDQFKDKQNVEFITNADGTISMLIKNIGHLEAKF